jgi:hypothetical protein
MSDKYNNMKSITELNVQWRNGNLEWVTDYLNSLPPECRCHIAAHLTLALYRDYGESEANRLVNLLTEAFIDFRGE